MTAAERTPEPAEISMQHAVSELEKVFETIYCERMQGLPIVNVALNVKAIGFRPWDGHWLGALVTPWFINLILLYRQAPRQTQIGASITHELPCGPMAFTFSYDPRLGSFATCSLLSPVLEIATQEHAEAIAGQAMRQLLQREPDDRHTESPAPEGVRHCLDAADVDPKTDDESGDRRRHPEIPSPSAGIPKYTRREFFRRLTSRPAKQIQGGGA